MISNGLHHVSINVTDTRAARDFYVEVLGCTEIDRPDLGFPGTWLQVGAQQIHLLERRVPEPLGQHFALAVDDIDTAIATLRERGVEVPEPSEVPGVCRQTFFADPSGNRLELNQPL